MVFGVVILVARGDVQPLDAIFRKDNVLDIPRNNDCWALSTIGVPLPDGFEGHGPVFGILVAGRDIGRDGGRRHPIRSRRGGGLKTLGRYCWYREADSGGELSNWFSSRPSFYMLRLKQVEHVESTSM